MDRLYGEQLNNMDDVETIILEMYDDYNRTHIATNP